MKVRLYALALVFAALSLVGVSVLAPARASAAQASSSTSLAVPVSATSATGTFSGTFNINQFAVQNGQLVALGTVTGTATNTLSGVTTQVNQTVAAVVTNLTNGSGTCTILDLTIGPINLNLLGLVIQTNTIHLTITAQQGPGNLLGNLLCAVANLFNGNGSLNAVATILNNLLGSLQL